MRRELVCKVVFSDLDHARLELSRFQGRYNKEKKHSGIGWVVLAERYSKEAEALQ